MASINKVILIGNLGRDPEVRYSSDGNTAITTLNLATSRRYRGQDGQPVSETEWHRVVVFGKSAEFAKDYLKKGSQAYIEGRLRTRKWQDSNGQDRWSTEIIAETLQSLDRRETSGGDADFSSEPRTPRHQPVATPTSANPINTNSEANSLSEIGDDVPF